MKKQVMNSNPIMSKRWSRREFTRHAGLATLFAPFISLFDTNPVQAQAAGKAKYLLLFHTLGTNVGKWAPQGSDSGITAFSSYNQPLSALQDSVILVDGLSGGGLCAGHGSPGGLCGASWGSNALISIDQFVSDGLKSSGIKTQIPHLVLGDGTTEQKTTFYRDNQPLTPVSSTSAAYSAIFSGRSPASTPDPTTPGEAPAIDQRLVRRQSVLDLMNAELTQLSNALGQEERAKLEVHAESLRQIEDRLAAQMGGGGEGTIGQAESCVVPTQPAGTGSILQDSSLLMSLAISAFGCDLTRVAAVQFGHHQRAPVEVPGVTGEWHNEFMHDPNKTAQLDKLEQWLSQEFVAAANQLKALPAPDGSGTLYDQTLMAWVRDMGDAINHGDTNMVYVFAGGAGGYLKHSGNGRYFKGGGAPHIKALTACADAMGVGGFDKFGTGADKTPLSQLTG
jgi:hypothetical protein